MRSVKYLLIGISLILGACCTSDIEHLAPETFDAEWVFIEVVPNEVSACLKQEDVIRLRGILNRCESYHEE